MKIVKIYSNKPFKNVEFNTNFNVILGDIYDKTQFSKDSHNLGKSSLIKVIDFLMLDTLDDTHFLFKYKNKFDGYVFFMELLLNSGNYLILKRELNKPSKISFKVNKEKLNGFIIDLKFDREDVPFEKAKILLNSYLNFDIATKWNYRKSISYFLRTQYDYKDIFQLDKFKGQHKDWKPFLFDLLGFNGDLLKDKYHKEDKISVLDDRINKLKNEFNVNTDEADKLKGILQIKLNEKESFEENIDNFNFYTKDKKINEELVEQIDNQISTLNTIRYNLAFEKERLQSSLKEEISNINVEEIEKLFAETKIYFPNNLKKEYKDLEEFNKKISTERKKYLLERLTVVDEDLLNVDKELFELDDRKSSLLVILTDKNSYDKFKIYQKNLAKTEADILNINNKLENINKVNNLENEIDVLKSDLVKITKKIKKSIITSNEHYSNIRKYFYESIKQILHVPAIISIKPNKYGNIDFNADIQDVNETQITAEGFGNTYRKLLCASFDIATLITYQINSFYRFVYHDGIWEGLDDRRKINYLKYIRHISKKYDLQYILTTINSDIPRDENENLINFSPDEIVMTLNDKDEKGKLFEMSF